MRYRTIGDSELEVSVVGLGANTYGPPKLDQTMTTRNIRRAEECGINFIDTAAMYGEGKSEEYIGNALADRRERFVLATKFHFFEMEPEESASDRIRSHCEQSLRKLQTDYIDLLQVHFPDTELRHEEVLEPLQELVEEGKVREVGECNYASWRHAQSDAVARREGYPEFVSAQNHYNLLRRQPELELLPFCESEGIGFLPYFPLAGGFLTGKYRPGEPPPEGSRGDRGEYLIKKMRREDNERILLQLEEFAEQRGHTILDLAFAWLLAHDAVVSVIAGNSNPEQVEQNAAAGEWVLTEDEKAEVDRIAYWDGSDEPIEPSMSYFVE